MSNQLSLRWAALAAAGILATAGCQSSGTGAAARTETPSAPPAAEPIASEPTPPVPLAALESVYFDFDRWELRDDAQQVLQANAKQIQAQPEWGVLRIEGHCDERGSEEYNMALGDRRATAVKRYLVDLGVPAARLETVTYGESRPAVAGHDETAWRLNRRSDLTSEAVRSAKR